MDIHHNHRIYRCSDRNAYNVLYCLWLNMLTNEAGSEAEFLATAAELIAEGRVA